MSPKTPKGGRYYPQNNEPGGDANPLEGFPATIEDRNSDGSLNLRVAGPAGEYLVRSVPISAQVYRGIYVGPVDVDVPTPPPEEEAP